MHCTTEDLRIKLAQALIIPHLDYCNTVYLDMSMTLKTRLQRLSNSGLRYIYGVRRDEHITPYRKKLNWLCIESRRLYFTGIIIYKILRLNQPLYLTNLFIKYVPKDNVRGSSRTKELSLPAIKDCGSFSFQLQGAIFWNSIPSDIRFLPSLNFFKAELHKHLLSLDPE